MWVDLGSGVYAKFHTCAHSDEPSGALIRFGGEPEQNDDWYDHDEICVGGISWCPDCSGPTWDLVSLNPLHVEPSVRTTCHQHPEHHGFIREGNWVPA